MRNCYRGVTCELAMKRVRQSAKGSVDAVMDASSLPVVVRYWPGRWRPSTIVAAMALEPLAGVGPLSAQEWPAVLDDLDRTLWEVGERWKKRRARKSV